MLELKDVKKTYPGGSTALDGIDLTIGPGEIVGLFGENGAGKTTLMKCVLGLLRYQGTITLDGAPVTTRNIARLSFATCEHSYFPALTAKAHRAFYQEHFPNFRAKRFEALMDFFQLPMGKAIRGFSTGQKNQFELILALSQGADYILMDEPFAGNDIFNREDFYKVLLIGRAVLLHQGKVAGDVTTLELEEQGRGLMDFVKETYRYQADRVSRALDHLTDRE